MNQNQRALINNCRNIYSGSKTFFIKKNDSQRSQPFRGLYAAQWKEQINNMYFFFQFFFISYLKVSVDEKK